VQSFLLHVVDETFDALRAAGCVTVEEAPKSDPSRWVRRVATRVCCRRPRGLSRLP
jgi:hypothetical protein